LKLQTKRSVDKWLGYFLVILFVPITRVLGVLLRRDHSIQKPPKTILFIKLLGLGSLVQASEMVMDVRKKYPGSKIILLSDPNIAAGINYFKLFDESWCIRNASFANTLTDSCRLLYKCWRMRGLWIVDLEVYSKLTTVYSLMTLGVNRFGFYLKPVFFRKFLNTHNILFDQSGFIEDNYQRMDFTITGNDLKKYNIQIKKSDLSKPFIAINNTCSDLSVERKLPDATIAMLCRWILQNTDYSIVLLGSPSDKFPNEKFISNFLLPASRVRNLSGMNFESYYRFLETECSLVITIDSAPLHIARKLGIPTVSIWGPTSPSNYLKLGEKEKELNLYYYSKAVCSPCVHKTGKLPCNGNNFCMKDISAEEIISKIEVFVRKGKMSIEA
jgi:ADP-heptose:LPS heptosyltransferase